MNTPIKFNFEEIKSSKNMPSPAGVVLEIMRITAEPGCSLPDVAQILRSDPALSGQILKFVNSAYLSLTRPINSVDDAVIHLGMALTKQLAFSFSLLSNNKKGACADFDYDQFWARSLVNATSAQTISLHSGNFIPEDIFTVALLSNIGQLALASVYPQEYAEVLQQHTQQTNIPLTEIEQQLLGVNHSSLTAMMLRDWNLLEEYSEGINLSVNLSKLDFNSTVVNLTDLLSFATKFTDFFLQKKSMEEITKHLSRELNTFYLTEESSIEVLQKIQEKTSELAEIFNINLFGNERELSSPEPEIKKTSGIIILVIDDDVITLKRVSKQLTNMGHQVLTAEDGVQGLKLALSEKPDVIFTDWQMPKIDGPALCKMIRKTPIGQQTYIIMLTGREKEEELIQALNDGADDYIVKPFSPKVLEARLRSGLRLINTQKELEKDKSVIQSYAAKLMEINQRFEKLALTDELTKLPNRRHGMQRMKQLFASRNRDNCSFSCLLIDIDHFKKVNDVYGHDIGDLALQKTAQILSNSLRDDDFVCRYGGEEFLVLCSGTTEAHERILAERLRLNIETANMELPDGRHVKITISIGLAISRQGTEHTEDELLKQADVALYKAKQAGRNCFMLA